MKRPAQPQPLTLTEAIIPVGSLIALVALSYFLFGDAGALGPNQVALVVATMIARVHRLAPRPFARVPRQGGDGKRRHGHRRDLHPVRRRRADRHLGDERHAGGDGLLRAAAAQPELLLRDRLRDLRHRLGQHRQLVDGRRHDRRRLHGHRRQHGAQPGHRRRRGDLGRLLRRQVVAALRLGQSRRRRRRRRPLRAPPGDRADLAGGAGDLDGGVLHAGPARRLRRDRQDGRRSGARFTSRRCCSCRSRWSSCSPCSGSRRSPRSSSAPSPAACSP